MFGDISGKEPDRCDHDKISAQFATSLPPLSNRAGRLGIPGMVVRHPTEVRCVDDARVASTHHTSVWRPGCSCPTGHLMSMPPLHATLSALAPGVCSRVRHRLRFPARSARHPSLGRSARLRGRVPRSAHVDRGLAHTIRMLHPSGQRPEANDVRSSSRHWPNVLPCHGLARRLFTVTRDSLCVPVRLGALGVLTVLRTGVPRLRARSVGGRPGNALAYTRLRIWRRCHRPPGGEVWLEPSSRPPSTNAISLCTINTSSASPCRHRRLDGRQLRPSPSPLLQRRRDRPTVRKSPPKASPRSSTSRPARLPVTRGLLCGGARRRGRSAPSPAGQNPPSLGHGAQRTTPTCDHTRSPASTVRNCAL